MPYGDVVWSLTPCEFRLNSMNHGHTHVAVVVKTNGIPFWLVGEFTTHFRTYFSGNGMFTGGTGF